MIGSIRADVGSGKENWTFSGTAADAENRRQFNALVRSITVACGSSHADIPVLMDYLTPYPDDFAAATEAIEFIFRLLYFLTSGPARNLVNSYVKDLDGPRALIELHNSYGRVTQSILSGLRAAIDAFVISPKTPPRSQIIKLKDMRMELAEALGEVATDADFMRDFRHALDPAYRMTYMLLTREPPPSLDELAEFAGREQESIRANSASAASATAAAAASPSKPPTPQDRSPRTGKAGGGNKGRGGGGQKGNGGQRGGRSGNAPRPPYCHFCKKDHPSHKCSLFPAAKAAADREAADRQRRAPPKREDAAVADHDGSSRADSSEWEETSDELAALTGEGCTAVPHDPPTPAVASAAREHEFIDVTVDTAASRHLFNSDTLFTSFSGETPPHFIVPASKPSRANAVGTVTMRVKDVDDQSVDITLDRACKMTNNPHNLLSVPTLLGHTGEARRIDNPDLLGHTITFTSPPATVPLHRTRSGLLALRARPTGTHPSPSRSPLTTPLPLEAAAPADSVTKERPQPRRGTVDWQIRRSYYRALREQGYHTGQPRLDVFTDRKGPVLGNSQEPLFYDGNAYDETWTAHDFFINPPWTSTDIWRTLEKQEHDFALDPEHTSYLTVLPNIKSAPWRHLTLGHHVVEVIPSASTLDLFSRPREHTFSPSALRSAGDEGGPDRVFVQECPVDVLILYRDNTTPRRADDYLKAHVRFGHYGSQHIIRLLEAGVNTGLQLSAKTLRKCDPLCGCVACKLAKTKRPRMGKAKDPDRHQAAAILSHVSTDIHGPVPVTSHSGMRYLVVFVCLRTRWTAAHFMSQKDELLDCILAFMQHVKTLGHAPIHFTFRADNESVYIKGRVRDHFLANGIGLETCPPYLHEGNAYSEVTFRVVFDCARAMMFAMDADPQFWPLAVRHAVWLRNRLPNRTNAWRIPYREVFGKNPDLSTVRTFWSPAYRYIDAPLRKKLDKRVKPQIYVGHSDLGHHLLLDPISGKVQPAGKPVVDEPFDILGKRVATEPAVLRDVLKFDREFDERPAPYQATVPAAYEFSAPHTVTDLTAWCDVDSCTNLALVQADAGPDGATTWMPADAYLTSYDDKWAAFDNIVQHLLRRHRAGLANDLYPLFALVDADADSISDHRRAQALITRVDVSSGTCDRTVYTVAFHPKIDISGSTVHQRTAQQVHFKRSTDFAIACATFAPITTQALTNPPLPDPTSYRQALGRPDHAEWTIAVHNELRALVDKGVLLFGTLPAKSRAIATRYVLKKKLLPDGSLDKHKARIVVKGFLQRHGIDYDETFSPTFQLVSLRCLIANALRHDMRIFHIDVKTAFLNSDLKYDIWIELPENTRSASGHTHAKLGKSLYGLKQAGRDWFTTQHDFLMTYDPRFAQSAVEPCLYYLWTDALRVTILVHVDDYVVATSHESFYREFNRAFDAKFGTNDLGLMNNIMQMGVIFSGSSCALSQTRQIEETAQHYGVLDCKPVYTPMEPSLHLTPAAAADAQYPFRQLLGSLLWFCRCTRPEISFALAYLSPFSNSFSQEHFGALKRVLKYLYTTRARPLIIRQELSDRALPVQVWSDADYASCKNTRRSVSGHLITIGNSPVAWGSKRQHTVALSSCESEYMAMTDAAKSALYVVSFFEQFKAVERPVPLHYDNQGSGYLAGNEVNNDRSKHIDVRHHFIRQQVAQRTFRLDYVPTATNLADIFTKALPREPFERFANLITDAPA